MATANRAHGDAQLARLFDEFNGRLVTPSIAAELLGLERQTVHTLCERMSLRAFRGTAHARWVLIPLDDVYAYAKRTHRTIVSS